MTIGEASSAAARPARDRRRNADQLVTEAKDEADKIIGEARTKAERLESEARSLAERLESDATRARAAGRRNLGAAGAAVRRPRHRARQPGAGGRVLAHLRA